MKTPEGKQHSKIANPSNSLGDVSETYRYRNDLHRNNNILSILCRIVYETKGLTALKTA
jgi:hypothetical protein